MEVVDLQAATVLNKRLTLVFSCEFCEIFKDMLKAFDDFKNKQESV